MSEERPSADAIIKLVEITRENLVPVIDLAVGEEQTGYVAPNSMSIAQYHYAEDAWMKAIYADDIPVGFVLMSQGGDPPRFYLWRYMVDARYQGLGFGMRALDLVIDHVRGLGGTELFLSFVPGPHGPRDFYAKAGFIETGVKHGDELEMRLELQG